MKKIVFNRDTLVIVLLFTLLLAWGPIYRMLAPPTPAAFPAAQAARTPAPTTNVTNTPAPVASEPVIRTAPPETMAEQNAPGAVTNRPTAPEQRVFLSNGLATVTLSSWGGGVVSAELRSFRETVDPASGPVVLDFSARPALSYEGLPGFSANDTFTIVASADRRTARIERSTENGLHLVRTVTLQDRYDIRVSDTLSNESPEAVQVPPHGLDVGPMQMQGGKSKTPGVAYLGIDTLAPGGGQKVHYWGTKSMFSHDLALPDVFQEPPRRGGGCSMTKPNMTRAMPLTIAEPVKGDTDWIAVKNKFFVQILSSEPTADGFVLRATREGLNETPDDPRTWASSAFIKEVAATLSFGQLALAPGTSITQRLTYYVGPKELSSLEAPGNHRDKAMEFGPLEPFCKILLRTLNWIDKVLPNYGVAIILLTLIIRVVFWPVTHKSTESMKKMQALQPEIAALREKYKDKPQKLQQETMALYKARKVNPLGGCLPTLIQIPVFIALFVVLRSAIELRFAPFLWIKDLSNQEGLLAGVLPFPINILPILMAATMAWQQKLTPTVGDASQQKVMMFMPVMMLFLFYTMPSALLLYWTTNQCLMIVQLLHQRRKQHATEGNAGSGKKA